MKKSFKSKKVEESSTNNDDSDGDEDLIESLLKRIWLHYENDEDLFATNWFKMVIGKWDYNWIIWDVYLLEKFLWS